ncbi:cytochrome ubiquinol oxidase subunit I [Patulibacter minatonensis]|uniref:cytochrome ubiquinol oxidase subunit I n=1 Tax=Patulibacter minatonensis TaxID=298163 RepID=UPI00068420DF|nr:cytochrome ubiquinol oxidase subunit I [Patulibacter minatonensis]
MLTPLTAPLASVALDLSRWQFALTTLIHFSIVAVSIGLTFQVAVMQTRWRRTGDEVWLRLTKYYAKAMLLCFGVGVVTGLIQTFQLGMNWAGFSRYAGDIFGAPLALEGLGAFFVESVFLGLWVFGWGRLGPRLHLACLWIVGVATLMSAYAILTANTWMQGPRGYEIVDGKAQVTDVWAIFLNVDVGLAFAHVVLTALLTGCVVVLGIAAFHLLRGRDVDAFSRVAKQACAIGLVAGSLGIVAGHFQGVRAVDRQPMKMAAAEALYTTSSPAPLSLFAIGPLRSNPGEPTVNVKVPALLSLIDDFSVNAKVRGIDDLQREAVARYGPGNYVPNVPLLYWSFRIMLGMGTALVGLMALGLLLARRNRLASSKWFLRAAMAAVAAPFLAQAGGWVLREGGRQPWIIQGLLKTADGRSANVGAVAVAVSLVVFLTIYLGTVALALRTMRHELAGGLGPDPEHDEDDHGGGPDPGSGTPGDDHRDRRSATAGLALTY